jgi:hypothetical protein
MGFSKGQEKMVAPAHDSGLASYRHTRSDRRQQYSRCSICLYFILSRDQREERPIPNTISDLHRLCTIGLAFSQALAGRSGRYHTNLRAYIAIFAA